MARMHKGCRYGKTGSEARTVSTFAPPASEEREARQRRRHGHRYATGPNTVLRGIAAMDSPGPRYYLFSDCRAGGETGRWRFVLRGPDGSQRMMAEDREPGVRGERLELLSVVRGLESLEEPSRVTLMTSCTYVREGVRHGLNEWRNNGWRWERFGQMVPVKDLDLWQRVDRAMEFHQVDCRTYRVDPPHGAGPGAPGMPPPPARSCRGGSRTLWRVLRRRLQYGLTRIASATLGRSVDVVR